MPTGTILLVEDEPAILKMGKGMIERFGIDNPSGMALSPSIVAAYSATIKQMLD